MARRPGLCPGCSHCGHLRNCLLLKTKQKADTQSPTGRAPQGTTGAPRAQLAPRVGSWGRQPGMHVHMQPRRAQGPSSGEVGRSPPPDHHPGVSALCPQPDLSRGRMEQESALMVVTAIQPGATTEGHLWRGKGASWAHGLVHSLTTQAGGATRTGAARPPRPRQVPELGPAEAWDKCHIHASAAPGLLSSTRGTSALPRGSPRRDGGAVGWVLPATVVPTPTRWEQVRGNLSSGALGQCPRQPSVLRAFQEIRKRVAQTRPEGTHP